MSADGQALAVDRPTMLVTADARYVEGPGQDGADDHVRHPRRRRAIARSSRPDCAAASRTSSSPSRCRSRRPTTSASSTSTACTSRAPRRASYPHRKVAGQVLGLTEPRLRQGDRRAGAERERRARGTRRHADRDPRPPTGADRPDRRGTTSPQPGQTSSLTINANIQEQWSRSSPAPATVQGEERDGRDHGPQHGRDHRAWPRVPRVDPNDRAKLNAATTQNRVGDGPVRARVGVQGRSPSPGRSKRGS